MMVFGIDSEEIDIFTEARDVLASRRRELCIKYGTERAVPHARDSLAFRRLYGLEIEGAIPSEDAADVILIDYVEALDRNEAGAGSELHAFLADELHRNTLTTCAAHLLAGMHIALARGMAADEAMLTKPPAGRPSHSGRDERIRQFIQSENACRELAEAAGQAHHRSVLESYAIAARIFGLSGKTVRNICAGK